MVETYRAISRMKGSNSNTEREGALMSLIKEAREEEVKYIVRFVQGNLKIGAAEATM